MSEIWNRNGLSVNLCPSIGVSASLLIDRSGNAHWCLLSYWCVPPSMSSICWWIDQLIIQPINRWILMSEIWNRHGSSVNLFPSVGVSMSPFMDQSGNASWCMLSYWCVPFYVRFVYPLTDQLIDRSINRWILMSLIGNRHGPSPSPLYLCPSIGVSDSLLIDQSGNSSWCLMSYWCVPLSVCFVRLLIDLSINLLING